MNRPRFCINVIIVLALVALLGFQSVSFNQRIKRSESRVTAITERLSLHQSRTTSKADLEAARVNLEVDLEGALERVRALEARSDAAPNVIAQAAQSVVFLQGAYGFVDEATGKPLRYVLGPDDKPIRTRQGPAVSLDERGPMVENQFTGTAFVATSERWLLTNRHVVFPWEYDQATKLFAKRGLVPVMNRLVAYLPGQAESIDVELVGASDEADVAVLQAIDLPYEIPPLEISPVTPRPGDEVIVMGYPTGIKALLARAGPEFVDGLKSQGEWDFWRVARELASGRFISPLASQGIVGHVTDTSVVYDAETAQGGSGGPVLGLDGRVLAINSAVVPDFNGSNLGVPVAPTLRLLAGLAMKDCIPIRRRTMAARFDVVIIGGGNAGLAVAAVAHAADKRVAIIEEWDFGGTCPNRGCTPKKVLVAAAHALDEIERAAEHGIEVGEARIDWAKLIDREKDLIAPLPGAMENVARKRGEVFKGRAKFVGPNTIDVGGTLIEGDNIVIATGSKPRSLSIAGAQYLITSDDVLSERALPKDIVFIGGGVIAMEFSHVYARAGANVTILEMLPGILPRTDRDAVAAIKRESERIGISIRTGVAVKEISKVQGRLRVRFEHEGREQTLDLDRAVNGAGRVANVDGLDLVAGNVKHDGIRIETDPFLRSTSNPAVWVIGDALVSSAQLSPLATYEGQIVGRNIVDGPSIEPDYATVPSGIYTVPALSTVGLTEEEARERGLEVRVTTNDMTDWFSAKTYAETAAWAKTIVEEGSDRIVGAHLVGHQGEELIHLFALAMRNGIGATQIKETMFAFPTFSADIKSML